MGKNSRIEWTHHTFNPWWGCVKVSPGCSNCYAEEFARRTGFEIWGEDTGRRFFTDPHWREPLRWNREARLAGKRHRVFCGSMCDVLEERPDVVPHRERLWRLIEQTESLDWLLCTKRPDNFLRLFPEQWRVMPRPNVWVITTVEDEGHLWRAEEILRVPAVVRGLLLEPLLGPVVVPAGIDWIIVGFESGGRARPGHPDWARRLRDQAVAAKVPFFFKQWGEYLPAEDALARGLRGPQQYVRSAPTHNPQSPRQSQLMIRVGRQKAGRLLDGVEWSQVP